MTYAALTFGRQRYQVVAIPAESLELEDEQAREYFERTVLAPFHAYEEELIAHKDRVSAFIASARILSYDQAVREWKETPRRGLRKGPEPEYMDQVTIDGQTRKVPVGRARDLLDKEVASRYPAPASPGDRPTYESWAYPKRVEKRTWRAAFVTGEQTMPVDIGEVPGPFPVSVAIAELDRLEKDGWTILHVSEDHGLYQGNDAADEAFLTRVRYLLRKKMDKDKG